MCSPFAMLAMGPTDSKSHWSQRAVRLSAYHLGRLATYLVMGTMVAVVSFTFQSAVGGPNSSQWVGWCVGLLMIGLGMMRLFESLSSGSKSVQHSTWVLGWTRFVVSLRKRYRLGPVWFGSFLWGFSSTFLPCGWLYLFVMASAAASTPSMTIAMMVAFWIGTLPLLTAAAWSWSLLGPRGRFLIQPLASVCIIAFGFYTLLSRSQVDLSPIAVEKPTLQQIRDAMNYGLPCCREAPSRAGLFRGPSTMPKTGDEQTGILGFVGGQDARNP